MFIARIAFATLLLTVVAGSATAEGPPELGPGASMGQMLDYAYCSGWSRAKDASDLKLRSLREVLKDDTLWRLLTEALQIGICPRQIAQPASPAPAQPKAPSSTSPMPEKPRSQSTVDHGQASLQEPHRVVIQVTQNDAGLMNTALNNAENLIRFYEDRGEKVEVEFVAYGPGLSMLRSDTSPVKERLAAISGGMKNVIFSGCENTRTNQSRAENKEISLIPEARSVPTGIGRIVELEEQGWTYVRP